MQLNITLVTRSFRILIALSFVLSMDLHAGNNGVFTNEWTLDYAVPYRVLWTENDEQKTNNFSATIDVPNTPYAPWKLLTHEDKFWKRFPNDGEHASNPYYNGVNLSYLPSSEDIKTIKISVYSNPGVHRGFFAGREFSTREGTLHFRLVSPVLEQRNKEKKDAQAEAARIQAEADAKVAAAAAAKIVTDREEAQRQKVIAGTMSQFAKEAMVEMAKRTAAREKLAAKHAGPQVYVEYLMRTSLVENIMANQSAKLALEAKHAALKDSSNEQLASVRDAATKNALDARTKADQAHKEAQDACNMSGPQTFSNYQMQMAEVLKTASDKAAKAALEAQIAAAQDTNNRHLTDVSGSMARVALDARLLAERADSEARLAREKAFETTALAHIEKCIANNDAARDREIKIVTETVNELCSVLEISAPKGPKINSLQTKTSEEKNAETVSGPSVSTAKSKFTAAEQNNTVDSQSHQIDKGRKLNLEKLINHPSPGVQNAAKELLRNPNGAARVDGMLQIQKMINVHAQNHELHLKSKNENATASSSHGAAAAKNEPAEANKNASSSRAPAKKWAPVETQGYKGQHTHVRKPQSEEERDEQDESK